MDIATQPALPVLLSPASAPALADLVVAAHGFHQAARSANTLKAYATDWADFDRWCTQRALTSLPADPATLILYVTDLATRAKVSTITRRLSSIAVAHQQHGHPSPTGDPHVRQVTRGIRRTLGTAVDEAAPLTTGALRKIVWSLPDTTIGTRDRALLLVGFTGALRRSELVALDVTDLEPRDEGMTALIRRSKTDPEAQGRRVALPWGKDEHTCPVTAINAWLDRSETTDGPLFRPVNRHGQLGAGRLTAQAVSLVVKRAVEQIGLDPTSFSGHSLRAGFATTAAAAGASERAIAAQTGHRSMEVLRRYVRHGSVFTDNAATSLGL